MYNLTICPPHYGGVRGGLFHIQHQAFKVLAFRMVDVDGMVGRLVQLAQDANFPLCNCSCGKDCSSELVLVDCLRATESEENTSWLYLLESLGIELCVATKGIMEGILVLSKGRRVKDDEIVLSTAPTKPPRGEAFVLPLHGGVRGGPFHELEGIFCKGFMTVVTREVKFHIGIHKLNGFCAAVHRMNQFCSTSHCIDAEASCVAEHVEHLAAF